MVTSQIRQAAVGMRVASREMRTPIPRSRSPKIARSIRQFSFTIRLIVDENSVMLAEHGRWPAAQRLRLPTKRLRGVHMRIDTRGRRRPDRRQGSKGQRMPGKSGCTPRCELKDREAPRSWPAERVGRYARALEIELRSVDVAICRWQAFTRRVARQRADGLR